MRAIDRRSAATSQTDAWEFLSRVTSLAGDADSGAAANTPRTRFASVMLPLLLGALLVLVTVWLSPATAQLCERLEDLPCGP